MKYLSKFSSISLPPQKNLLRDRNRKVCQKLLSAGLLLKSLRDTKQHMMCSVERAVWPINREKQEMTLLQGDPLCPHVNPPMVCVEHALPRL